MNLSKYGYYNKRSRDKSLTKRQQNYAKSFMDGANNPKGTIETTKAFLKKYAKNIDIDKININKLAFKRGQQWQKKTTAH